MNPVLHKDLLGLLRLRRIAVLQIAFVSVLAALVLANWPQQGIVSLESQARDTLQTGLLLGQLLLLVLFVPGIASVALTTEREGGTLEMLYASRLSPLQIVLGKIGSSLAMPMLLLLAGLPFVALIYYRGSEIDASAFWQAYLVIVLAAVFLSAVSLAISALCAQTATALVIAYLVVLVIAGGVMVPALIMLDTQQGAVAQWLHYLRSISPVAALLSILRPDYNDLAGRVRGFAPAWQVFAPFATLAILISLAIVIARLSKPPIAPERSREVRTRSSIGRRLLFLVDPEKQRKPLGRLNPLFYKEGRTNALRSGRWMIRIFYGSLALAFGLALMSLYGGSEYGDLLDYVARILVVLLVTMVAMVSPSLTTASISGEIEGGTFEMLRMSRLGGGQIFWGKFLPAFAPAVLPAIALAPAFGALIYIDNAMLVVLYKLLPLVAVLVATTCAIGLMCSSITANSARATVIAYVIVSALLLLPMLPWLASGESLDPAIARWLAMPSPLVMSLNLLPSGSPAMRQLYEEHILVIAALGLAALIAARVRLSVLLHRG